ncbi:MAG: HAD hydrolase family protein [Candidatus Omnitrophica bacterium]|nr:HAD hydrolase family protein [Candidatus Omnitrophota bacterium]
MDVDGVLTDGRINLNELGQEIKSFDVHDGFGMVLLRRAGYKTAIISARASAAVKARAKDLLIDKIYQDAYPKIAAYEALKKTLQVSDEQVCYVGDDLPDLPVLRQAGFAVAVSNAVQEVRLAADYVTKAHGGRGAVREVVELILKTQGRWDALLTA